MINSTSNNIVFSSSKLLQNKKKVLAKNRKGTHPTPPPIPPPSLLAPPRKSASKFYLATDPFANLTVLVLTFSRLQKWNIGPKQVNNTPVNTLIAHLSNNRKCNDTFIAFLTFLSLRATILFKIFFEENNQAKLDKSENL